MGRWRKFRRHPKRYLMDSSFVLFRRVGKALDRHDWLEPRIRRAVYDPRSEIDPILRPLLGRARRHRHRTVEVIVASYNNAATLPGAIQSLRAQTLPPSRIIVIDDASTDDSAAIVERLTETDSSIELVRLPSNRGAAYARNLGMSLASADFVTFQDADDVSHPRRLEWQLAQIDAPAVVAVTCDGCRIAGGEPVELDGHFYHELSISVMFRRSDVLGRVGYFRPLEIGEDVEYLARLRAAFGTRAVRHLRKCLYLASLREGSAIHRHGKMQQIGPREYRYIPSEETARKLEAIEKSAAMPDSWFFSWKPEDTR